MVASRLVNCRAKTQTCATTSMWKSWIHDWLSMEVWNMTEPAVPIGRVYFVCRLLVLYTDFACVARERRCVGELTSGCLQTKLTLTVILLLQYVL